MAEASIDMRGALAAPEHARPASSDGRRRIGVRGRLYAAFASLAFLVVVASAVSFFALSRVDRALSEITGDSVPLVISSLDLSRQAERIVSAAPALLSVEDFEQLSVVSSSLNADVLRLNELLEEIARFTDETQAIGSIRRAVEQLRGTLEAMNRVVGARLAIEANKNQLLEQAIDAIQEIEAAIQPLLVSNRAQIEELRRSPAAALPDSAFVDAVELDARLEAAGDELTLVRLRLREMANATDPQSLSSIALNISWSVDRLRQLGLRLDDEVGGILNAALDRVSTLNDGPQGLRQLRLTELQLIDAGEKSREENAGLAERFSAGVDRMVEAVERSIIDANADALATKQLTGWVLAAVVFLSIVGSVLIVWLYVQKNVIARLTRLTDSMMAIARGDLERDLPSSGPDEIGRMAQALTVFRDTAVEVKETNLREISEARRRLDDAIESTQEGFALFDAEDRLILRNSKYGELLYENTDVPQTGAHYETILRRAVKRGLIRGVPEDPEGWIQARLADHRNPTESQIQQRASGRWLRVNEHRTEDGGTVVIYSDITALQKRQEELEEMDRLKSQFLSSVSHELRTPLTSVRGFAKLVLKDFERFFLPLVSDDPRLAKKAERISDNIQIVQSEGERLTRLINEVLDLAKIESGDVQWNDSNFHVRDLVEGAFRASMGHFENKPDLEPILELDDDLPMAHADFDRLFQVLINLINNAAKFTESGSVRVKASRQGDGWVDIRVIDTGPGIAPAELAKVFDKFHQVMTQDTLSDKPKGTGLGLSISKQIVEHYGGSIWVESLVGEGSTFGFKFPSFRGPDQIEVAGAGAPGPRDRAKGRILVVEDDDAFRTYLERVLADVGFDVHCAANGAEAIEKAARLRPDLITMDHRMPHMDGGAAIRTLRSSDALREIPVIYITGHAKDTGAEADVVLEKPVLEPTLLRNVRLLLGARLEERAGDASCLVVAHDGQEPAVPGHLLEAAKIERCTSDELAERLARGFDGVVVLTEDFVSTPEFAALVSSPGIWSVATVGRRK